MESNWRQGVSYVGLSNNHGTLVARILGGIPPYVLGLHSSPLTQKRRFVSVFLWPGYRDFDVTPVYTQFVTTTHFPHGYNVVPDLL